jgi:uncharacterized protein (DUF1778 family)
MNKLEAIKQKLVHTIHEELTGDLSIDLNKSHFDLLEEATGLSKRKLKEFFGVYKPRSQKSHEYSLDRLAEFAGYKSWSTFIKSHSVSKAQKSLAQHRQIELKKKISIRPEEQKKVQISIVVK